MFPFLNDVLHIMKDRLITPLHHTDDLKASATMKVRRRLGAIEAIVTPPAATDSSHMTPSSFRRVITLLLARTQMVAYSLVPAMIALRLSLKASQSARAKAVRTVTVS